MFEELRNNIDFFIRNHTKFSRKNYLEKNPELIKQHQQENAYIKEVLDCYFEKKLKEPLMVLDIGSKNWSYAKGLHSFFASFSQNFFVDGVELDAYRLYSNFYSRQEVAKFYIKDFDNFNYIADDLLNVNNKYDYITWFLPFVLKDPLVYWGLPRRYFCPQKLLNHAYSLLNTNGQLLIINQGEAEAKAQKELLEGLSIPYSYLAEINNEYFSYKHKRYGFLIRKND